MQDVVCRVLFCIYVCGFVKKIYRWTCSMCLFYHTNAHTVHLNLFAFITHPSDPMNRTSKWFLIFVATFTYSNFLIKILLFREYAIKRGSINGIIIIQLKISHSQPPATPCPWPVTFDGALIRNLWMNFDGENNSFIKIKCNCRHHFATRIHRQQLNSVAAAAAVAVSYVEQRWYNMQIAELFRERIAIGTYHLNI